MGDANPELNNLAMVQRIDENHPHHDRSAMVSGDSDDHETSEDDDAFYNLDPSDPANEDMLYDANLDDEDEAYVYKHMRGGVQETVTIILTPSENGDGTQQQVVTKEVYKPRNSDAVLSCPCCFNIVCMDCQRHKRYQNQFRAMYVMGIVVDWTRRLVYDELKQGLVTKVQLPNEVPPDIMAHPDDDAVVQEYFPVNCANCRTQVAALDLSQEVYHFFDCLESA